MDNDERHPVDRLADEFAQRLRAGESPTVEEYLEKYPEHAALIQSIFPSIALVERVSVIDSARLQQELHRSLDMDRRFSSMPERLGDFRLIREIGRGGMGIVYEAIQLSLKRRVALKVVGTSTYESSKQLERFRREAEAAACLHHTNIIPVFGIGEDQGKCYYAMQLIEGVPLADLIRYLAARRTTNPVMNSSANASSQTIDQFHVEDAAEWLLAKSKEGLKWLSPLPDEANPSPPDIQTVEISSIPIYEPKGTGVPETIHTESHSLGGHYFRRIARMIMQVASALQYAHQQGVLHRDIKPGNLILDREGTIWVADFGLARMKDTDGVTQTGEIIGTLRYMAPEQIEGSADPRTDIYSLGLTLYELLTLRPAIEQPKSRFLDPSRYSSILLPRSIQPDIPNDLQTITLKACSADPAHRYASASEFEEDLRRFLEDRPILARRANSIERMRRWAKRNPIVAGLSFALFGLLMTIAIILGIANQQKLKSIDEIQHQFTRAERNLVEKTAALANVERERKRAETNLDLAIQAFDSVVKNISSRGGVDSILEDIAVEEESIAWADSALSDADIVLLETLLEFFDRFAVENAKDLGLESARARHRVGVIQERLGRLEDALRSYEQSNEIYHAIAEAKPDDVPILLAQIDLLNDLVIVLLKRGEIAKSIARVQEARKLLERSPHLSNLPEVRFAKAKVLSNVASWGSKLNRDPKPRLPRGPFAGRNPGQEAPIVNLRARREAEANEEAIRILQELLLEEAASVPYRTSLGKALKDEVRIARGSNDWKRAEESLNQAIQIFEELLRDHPQSEAYQYELADALNLSPPLRINESRIQRAMEICSALVVSRPQAPQYQSLSASIHIKIATMQYASGQRLKGEESLRQAIAIQTQLAEKSPDVLTYQIALVQSLQQAADMHRDMKRIDLAKKDIDQAIAVLEKARRLNRFGVALQSQLQRLKDRRQALDKAERSE